METIEKTIKIREIIKGIRASIKALATEQKDLRLHKLQKSHKLSAELTALHRLYLKIRNKSYEEVHHFNHNTKYYAKVFTEKYNKLWNVCEIFPD